MTNQAPYLRYLESVKLAETAERLKAEGYTVEENKRVDGITFDLAATRNGQTVVYEFRSEGSSRITREALRRLQEVAGRYGFKFRLVVTVPPPRVQIEIEHLRDELMDYVTNKNFPQDLDALSNHTTVDCITDLQYSDIKVGDGGIQAKGSGNIGVQLHDGTPLEQGSNSSDAFPFYFTVLLDPTGHLRSVQNLSIDTSYFYE